MKTSSKPQIDADLLRLWTGQSKRCDPTWNHSARGLGLR